MEPTQINISITVDTQTIYVYNLFPKNITLADTPSSFITGTLDGSTYTYTLPVINIDQSFAIYGPISSNIAIRTQTQTTTGGLSQIQGTGNDSFILFIYSNQVTSPYATGGIVTHISGNTYAHVFQETGNFTVTSGSLNTSILCIGGGGGGGADTASGNGGGGAGAYGVIINQSLSGSYIVTVGANGTGGIPADSAVDPPVEYSPATAGSGSYINNITNYIIYSGGGGPGSTDAFNNNAYANGTDGSELTPPLPAIDNIKYFKGSGGGSGHSDEGSILGGSGGKLFLENTFSNGGIGAQTTDAGGGGGGGAAHAGYDGTGSGGNGGDGFTIDIAGINPTTLLHGVYNNFPDLPGYTPTAGSGKPPFYCCYGGGGGVDDTNTAGTSLGGGNGANGSSTKADSSISSFGSGGGGGGFNSAQGKIIGGGDGSSGLVIIYYTYNPICFPAGTEVETDQGLVEIQLIKPGFHTIGGKRIIAITKSLGTSDCLVKVSKSAISENIPNKDTIMTRWHKVHHGTRLRESWRLPNTHNHPYNGEFLYNVLIKTYEKMRVNNMIVETLHPNNESAKPYLNKN